jgi:hypothetical protein
MFAKAEVPKLFMAVFNFMALKSKNAKILINFEGKSLRNCLDHKVGHYINAAKAYKYAFFIFLLNGQQCT